MSPLASNNAVQNLEVNIEYQLTDEQAHASRADEGFLQIYAALMLTSRVLTASTNILFLEQSCSSLHYPSSTAFHTLASSGTV